MKTNWKAWKTGIKNGILIGLGILAISFTFGIIAKQSGLTPFEAAFMSATNFTSAICRTHADCWSSYICNCFPVVRIHRIYSSYYFRLFWH